jgi:hypothetical protein
LDTWSGDAKGQQTAITDRAAKQAAPCCQHLAAHARGVSSRIAASEESLPTLVGVIVSLLLINQFAMSRTKASVNPPAAIPKITGADT